MIKKIWITVIPNRTVFFSIEITFDFSCRSQKFSVRKRTTFCTAFDNLFHCVECKSTSLKHHVSINPSYFPRHYFMIIACISYSDSNVGNINVLLYRLSSWYSPHNKYRWESAYNVQCPEWARQNKVCRRSEGSCAGGLFNRLFRLVQAPRYGRMTRQNCKSRKGHFLFKDWKMVFVLKTNIFTPFNSPKFIQVYLPYLHTTATVNGT